MLENLRDHQRFFTALASCVALLPASLQSNAGDDLHSTTAVLTSLDIDPEDPFEALYPRHGDVLFGFGSVLFRDALLASSGRGDLRPPSAVGGEDAMETGEISARPWHQCRQSGNEIQWLEDHMRGAIPIGRLQCVTY